MRHNNLFVLQNVCSVVPLKGFAKENGELGSRVTYITFLQSPVR